MKIIMVEKQGLMDDLAAWGVAPNYARFSWPNAKKLMALLPWSRLFSTIPCI